MTSRRNRNSLLAHPLTPICLYLNGESQIFPDSAKKHKETCDDQNLRGRAHRHHRGARHRSTRLGQAGASGGHHLPLPPSRLRPWSDERPRPAHPFKLSHGAKVKIRPKTSKHCTFLSPVPSSVKITHPIPEGYIGQPPSLQCQMKICTSRP